jgi:hypothetical protein
LTCLRPPQSNLMHLSASPPDLSSSVDS